MWLIL